MAIVKKNEYMPGQNLTSLALNVDINRLGVDKVNIDVNYGTVPATVTIKEGSIIEVNGNLYIITGSDYSFQMANAAHNYITFTDNPSPTFGSSASRGTYRDDKKGFYQADNISRTLNWFIDQPNDLYCLDNQYRSQNLTKFKCFASNASGSEHKVLFDDIIFDSNSEFDAVNKRFVSLYGGYYSINCWLNIGWVAGNNVLPSIELRLNGAIIQYVRTQVIPAALGIAASGISMSYLIRLKIGDYIEIWAASGFPTSISTGPDSYLDINQII
jgi:hypothetical protein